jgi:uridine kinase
MAAARPFLVGISGGCASGKSSVCTKLADSLTIGNCVVVTTDSFYHDLTETQRENASEYNFDHPSAFDFDALHTAIQRLLNWETAEIPIYDYVEHRRLEKTISTEPGCVIVLEGIMAFFDSRIRQLMDFKIFINADDDERLARRVVRDTTMRGREIVSVIEQYRKFVKPAYDSFIAPMMRHADLIIPRGAENTVAVEMVVSSVLSSTLAHSQPKLA